MSKRQGICFGKISAVLDTINKVSFGLSAPIFVSLWQRGVHTYKPIVEQSNLANEGDIYDSK